MQQKLTEHEQYVHAVICSADNLLTLMEPKLKSIANITFVQKAPPKSIVLKFSSDESLWFWKSFMNVPPLLNFQHTLVECFASQLNLDMQLPAVHYLPFRLLDIFPVRPEHDIDTFWWGRISESLVEDYVPFIQADKQLINACVVDNWQIIMQSVFFNMWLGDGDETLTNWWIHKSTKRPMRLDFNNAGRRCSIRYSMNYHALLLHVPYLHSCLSRYRVELKRLFNDIIARIEAIDIASCLLPPYNLLMSSDCAGTYAVLNALEYNREWLAAPDIFDQIVVKWSDLSAYC